MDFKALREESLKKSQEEMAEMLGVGTEQIERWDNDASDITYAYLEKLAQCTGLKIDDICKYQKPKPKAIDAENTWEKADFTKKSVVGYIEDALDKMGITREQKERYIDGLQTGIQGNLVKPSIAIVGRSDTGKSTLINALIGMEKMPTAWTPTTSIAVYIKHIKDRPDFIRDDVWVFKNHVGNEDLWNVNRLYDRDYCEKWKIAQGGAEIIRNYGTRQGETAQREKMIAGSAVVFLDAKILQNCDIVDLPGFGTERESDDTTLKAAQRTDILIYLSQANGFMRIEDITYLKENIRNLPVWEKKGKNGLKPLSNLFVVASQAQAVNNGNVRNLNDILQKGYENFCKTLSDEYWAKREAEAGYSDYNRTALPKRFFTYTTDIPSLCSRFNDELKNIIEILPEIINERTKGFVRKYVGDRKPQLIAEINKYEKMIKERDEFVKLLQQIEDNELKRVRDNDGKKKEVQDLICRVSRETGDEFNKYCSQKINTDSIVQDIKNKNIENKKEDIECFVSQLQDELQNKCQVILDIQSKKVAKQAEEYVSQFDEGIKTVFDKFSFDADFDAGFAFANALAKIGVVGGLGAYILGQAAWALGSFTFIAGAGGGIALGAISLGPIGIVAGLAIAGIIGIVKLFGGGWEKTVAKKIVKAFEENRVVEKYRKGMEDYWDKTGYAFNEAARQLDREWDKYVKSLKDAVNNYDINELEDNIRKLKNMMSFFEHIPL